MPFEIKIDSQKFLAIEDKLRKDVNDILGGGALKKEIAEYAIGAIQYQARIGKPYNQDGSFPALKDSTISKRKYLAKYNQTHGTFDPERSNLTIIGAFLDSLNWRDAGNCIVRLFFDGSHPRYQGAKGQIGSEVENATLAEYLAEKGFKVFDASLKTNKQFVSRIKSICLGYIRRGLKVRSKLGA